jgi:hypothetical protein
MVDRLKPPQHWMGTHSVWEPWSGQKARQYTQHPGIIRYEAGMWKLLSIQLLWYLPFCPSSEERYDKVTLLSAQGVWKGCEQCDIDLLYLVIRRFSQSTLSLTCNLLGLFPDMQ